GNATRASASRSLGTMTRFLFVCLECLFFNRCSQDGCECTDQLRPAFAQLVNSFAHHALQRFAPTWTDRNDDLPLVVQAGRTLHVPVRLQSVHKPHSTVVAQIKTL